MEKHVRLKIFTPDKVYKEQDVRRVVVPGADGDLTVLPERAPTVMVLTNGYVRVLDEHDGITDKYFIRGGIANIADDICAISTEGVVSEDDTASSIMSAGGQTANASVKSSGAITGRCLG